MSLWSKRSVTQTTMDQIASDTGGKAFYNTNGIKEAIQTAVEQGSNYYMLSYTPANHSYDGRFRKLKVALAVKGYHVTYRRGYYAEDPFAPIPEGKDALSRDVGIAAMQHGSPQSHQIVFATRVIPVGKPVKVDPTKDAAGKKPKKNAIAITAVQHYAVDYAIAGPQLHFVDQGTLHHAVLAFMASAFDDDGKCLVSSRQPHHQRPEAIFLQGRDGWRVPYPSGIRRSGQRYLSAPGSGGRTEPAAGNG